MAREAGQPAIRLFSDVNEDDFDLILSSGVVEYESTYPYFKSLVMHLMQLDGKITPKAVETSLASLIKTTSSAGLVAASVTAMVGGIIPAIGAAAMIGLATAKLFEKGNITSSANNVFAPLISVAKTLYKK